MRGRCTCGALVDVVAGESGFTTPGHSCGAGAKWGAERSTKRDDGAPRRPATSSPFAPHASLSGRTLRLWLPRAVRSDEGPNGRAWKRKAAAAREWRALVAAAVEVLGDARPRWTRAAVRYELFTRGRAIDPDNRVALGKPILDGIVAAGVLPDDCGDQVESVTAAWAPSPLPWGFVRVTVERGTASMRPSPEARSR